MYCKIEYAWRNCLARKQTFDQMEVIASAIQPFKGTGCVQSELPRSMHTRLLATLIVALAFLSTSCATSSYELLFEPDDERVYMIYDQGYPLGYYEDESIMSIMAMSTEKIGGKDYLILWLALGNFSETPILFDPQTIGVRAITRTIPKVESYYLSNISDRTMLARLENKRNALLTIQTVAATLNSYYSTKPTTVTTNTGVVATVNDRDEKQAEQLNRNMSAVYSNAARMDAFRSAVAQNMFRKSTIFGGTAVSGNVYFEIPDGLKAYYGRIAEGKYENFEITIDSPTGRQTFMFKPVGAR